MINRIILVGRITKDPELRYTPSGIANVRFTLAVNRSFTGQNGEKEADFINCVAWRKQAENLANFQRKGNLIGVEGRIQTSSFEGPDGKRVYTTDVVTDSIQFLESRKESSEQPSQQANQSNQQQSQSDFGNNQPYNYQRETKNSFPSTQGNQYISPKIQQQPPSSVLQQVEDELPF